MRFLLCVLINSIERKASSLEACGVPVRRSQESVACNLTFTAVSSHKMGVVTHHQ